MLVLAITHPDAVFREPRSLSEGGRQQAVFAARRIRELVGKRTCLGLVAASPSARCLETAIIVSREFGESTVGNGLYEGRFQVIDDLEERPGKASKPETLHTVLAMLESKLEANIKKAESVKGEPAVLLAVYGDLANMLKGSAQFTKDFISKDEEWFESRPVIAVFTGGTESLTVKACEVLHGGKWVSCI